MNFISIYKKNCPTYILIYSLFGEFGIQLIYKKALSDAEKGVCHLFKFKSHIDFDK